MSADPYTALGPVDPEPKEPRTYTCYPLITFFAMSDTEAAAKIHALDRYINAQEGVGTELTEECYRLGFDNQETGEGQWVVPDVPHSEGDVLVRVSREILALLKTGDVEPVVMLGVHDLGDGTHEMVLQTPPRDLRVENEQLREALAELVEVMTGVRFEGLAARTAAVSDAWHRANEMVRGFDEGGPS